MKMVWMTVGRVGAVLLGVALIALSVGCVAVAAGAAAGGTVAYVRGELQETLVTPIEPATAAAEKAIAEFGLATEITSKNGLVSQFVARLADGTRVVIKLESISPSVTRVGIRVGLMGDKALSSRILDGIRGNV